MPKTSDLFLRLSGNSMVFTSEDKNDTFKK